MKRILSVLALAAAVSLAVAAGTQASQHVAKKSHVTHASFAASAAGQVCDPAKCGGSCPLGHTSATSATLAKPATVAVTAMATPATAAQYSFNGRACPVSDPSKCPASCPRASATATAVAAKSTSR